MHAAASLYAGQCCIDAPSCSGRLLQPVVQRAATLQRRKLITCNAASSSNGKKEPEAKLVEVEVENEDGQFQAVDGDERLMQELADADEETVARQLEELQREEPPAPPPTEEQLLMEHKTKILLEILTSGAELERKIQEHVEEIDDTLLMLLYRRIEASKRMDEGDDMVEGLTKLFWCLKAAAEEYNATPALRLLDAAIRELDSTNNSDNTTGDDDDADMEHRHRAVASLLQAAFTGRAAQQVDILSMAAAVARGQSVDPQSSSGGMGRGDDGFVPKAAFLKETSDLVLEAEQRIEQLRGQLEQLTDEDRKQALQQHIQAQCASLALVRQVMQIARVVGTSKEPVL